MYDPSECNVVGCGNTSVMPISLCGLAAPNDKTAQPTVNGTSSSTSYSQNASQRWIA